MAREADQAGVSGKQGPSDADYRALARFRHALRRFTAFSEEAARKSGLPAAQHQALLAIRGYHGEGAMTVGRLAELLLIAPHSATELAGRLMEAGLVTRLVDADDRRRHTLALTERAESLLGQLSLAHMSEIRSMAPALEALLRDLRGAGDA